MLQNLASYEKTIDAIRSFVNFANILDLWNKGTYHISFQIYN